jgi:DNA-binding response OmpR family regulator
MNAPSLPQRGIVERKRVIVLQQDPTIGCRLADWFAMHGYQAVLTRRIEDVQSDLPHIRPDVIVFSLDASAEPGALPRLQSVLPHVPIIAMAQPDPCNHQTRKIEQTTAFGAGVFVCRPSDRDESFRLIH